MSSPIVLDKKDIRMHILLDKKLRSELTQAAHDSWISVGQYIRDVVALFKGAHFDTASDWVMIGKSIGIDGFENLRNLADKKGVSVQEYCQLLGKNREPEIQETPEGIAQQLSLFD